MTPLPPCVHESHSNIPNDDCVPNETSKSPQQYTDKLNSYKQSKPPQIVLSLNNLNDPFKVITDKSLDNLTVKVNEGETVRIFFKDAETCRAIVNLLHSSGIELHTYQMKAEKHHRIVVVPSS